MWLDHVVSLFLTFWGSPTLLSVVVGPVCTPISSKEVFPSPPPTYMLAFVSIFLKCHLFWLVKWNLKTVLVCIFLVVMDVEHFLKYFSATIAHPWRSLVSWPIFNGFVCLFSWCFVFWSSLLTPTPQPASSQGTSAQLNSQRKRTEFPVTVWPLETRFHCSSGHSSPPDLVVLRSDDHFYPVPRTYSMSSVIYLGFSQLFLTCTARLWL